MNQPQVSIIIPAWNAQLWLAEAIESALGQGVASKEVIVVDDGSGDQTAAIARTFEPRGVRLLVQANRGASAARNAGLAAASGEWIQFLDADDVLDPLKIQLQLSAVGQAPGQLAAGPWGVFERETDHAVFTPEPSWCSDSPVDWLVRLWTTRSMMHPASWLCHRSVIERAGGWNEELSLDDDGEFFARVVLASTGVTFVPDARVFYRRHAGPRLSASRGDKAWSSGFRAIESKERALRAAEDSPRTRRACATHYARFAWDNFPEAGELARLAEQRWRELDPAVSPPRGSAREYLLSRLIGWHAARRLQKRLRSRR